MSTTSIAPGPPAAPGGLDFVTPPGTIWPLPIRLRPLDRERRGLVEVAVALAAIVAAAATRLAIDAVVPGVVPFVLTFPAVILATMLAGARAGLLAACGCQALVFGYVMPHWVPAAGGFAEVAGALLSSASLAVTIWGVSGARRLSREQRQHCERTVTTSSLLIAEMDHRTKNNFQVAAALLASQARECGNAEAAFQLGKMAARLGSIAAAYRNLSLAADRSGFDLTAYLGELIGLLNEGLIPPQARLALRGEPVTVDAQTGLMIGLLVNEWITNAVKYAVPAGADTIAIGVARAGDVLVVTVADNAAIAPPLRGPGTGSALMARLAQAVGGTIVIEQRAGTHCTLSLPLPVR